MKHALAVACTYEVGAIWVWPGRFPPITVLCGHHPWLAVAIVAAMVVHLVREVARVRRFA
jgi:hypothetical protein